MELCSSTKRGVLLYEITNDLLEFAGMKSNVGGHKELKSPIVKRDKNDLEKLKKLITSTIHPFSNQLRKIIFSI